MREKLQKQLKIKYPYIKDKSLPKYVNNYVDAVIAELSVQFATATSDELSTGEISFAEEAVAIKCKQAISGTQRLRTYAMMQNDSSTSLVLVQYKGNNQAKRVSKVMLNPKYRKEIFTELLAAKQLLTTKYLDGLESKSNYAIRIDLDALDSYIRHTRAAMQNSPNTQYMEKLYRNLSCAIQIRLRALMHDDGSYWVNEYWDMIDSGRMHGHGLSLQRIGKEVRHAALGRCAKIDFKASSYAILTSVALAINPKLKVEALKHYIKYRAATRKRIAKAVGISEDWMKTIFTSLGFGAELKDNPFSSIRKKLGKAKYDILIANEEFSQIKLALDDVRRTILANDKFKSDTLEIGEYKYSAIDPNTGKTRSRNQKLAWIYQALERLALDLVITKMPNSIDMLLPVHDCLYIRNPLPAHIAVDLKDELQQIFPLLTFEQEIIIPIHAAEDHSKYNDALDAEEHAHKQRIAEATREAQGYKSINISVGSDGLKTADYSSETDEQYEQRRKLQFMLDLHQHGKQLDADEFE